jgi:hypothetical protein
MRATAGVVLLVLGAAVRSAPAQEDGSRAPRDAVVEALAIEAGAAAPEFAADIILRLAGSARIQDRAWKRDLLEDA